jgi:hypothetical protein
VGQPSAVARLLALQGRAGNAAVNRLLRAPVAAPAAPTGGAGRSGFEGQLRARWGVTNVRAGTEADQIEEMRRMTPSAEASPTAIGGWQSWNPGDDGDLYDDILDAFELMAFVLGGIPEVNELRFLATDYENVGGSAEARPRHGASYSDGLLNVFRRMETMAWPLPQGRTTGTAYAQVAFGSASESRRRILIHELSHGVWERFGSPTRGGSVQLFRDWEAAVGWVNGRLEQNGTVLTDANWNDDWPDQPVSKYSLSNPMEDFAESLMCFIENGAVLRARSPARHKFIQSRRAGWASALRQPKGVAVPRLRGPRGDFVEPSSDSRYA